MREEHRLVVFENRELRNIFGHNRNEEEGHGENYIMKSFICAPHGGGRGAYKCLVRKSVRRGHLEGLGVDRRILNHKWDAGHGLD